MSMLEPTNFVYSYSKSIPHDALSTIWKRWSELSLWHTWDSSLKGTQAQNNGLALGKRFLVTPKGAPVSIPVTITGFIEGTHFTTVSQSPVGLLAFGHSLIVTPETKLTTLIHSICAVPTDQTFFATNMWDRLQKDVQESVSCLAKLASGENY